MIYRFFFPPRLSRFSRDLVRVVRRSKENRLACFLVLLKSLNPMSFWILSSPAYNFNTSHNHLQSPLNPFFSSTSFQVEILGRLCACFETYFLVDMSGTSINNLLDTIKGYLCSESVDFQWLTKVKLACINFSLSLWNLYMACVLFCSSQLSMVRKEVGWCSCDFIVLLLSSMVSK